MKAQPPVQSQDPVPLGDEQLLRMQALLDALPAPLQPMDVSALDGYLCGVLLQPRRVIESLWLAHVADIDGGEAPASAARDELHAQVRRRHAEIDAAIGARQWVDPWIYQLDGDASPAECVLPWSAGFAAAMELFPDLMAMDSPDLVEPLALLFMHFDPADLEDADALIEVIDTLEPAADIAEAVQDVVRALMLIADVTRPRAAIRAPRRAAVRASTRASTRPSNRPSARRPR